MCNITKATFEIKISKKIKDNYFIAVKLNDKIYSNFTAHTRRYFCNSEIDKQMVVYYKKLCTEEEFNIAKEFLINISDNFTKMDFAPIIEVQGEELEKMQEKIYKAIFAKLLLHIPNDGVSKLIIDEEVITDYVDKNDYIKIIYNDKFSKNIRKKTFNQMDFCRAEVAMGKERSFFDIFFNPTNNNAKEEPKRHKTLF